MGIMKKNLFFLVILISLILVGCWNEKWQRTGFYYPDRYNLWDEGLWVIEWWFDSLEECRDWAIWKWDNSNDDYDYECWFKCRQSGWFYICEKTLD